MNRLLPLAAMLLAASATHAQTQVTVYGIAAVEVLNVTHVNTGTLTAPVLGTDRRIDNSKVTNSRLGFRGTEDLGGGLSALFGFESAIGIDTGTQANTKFWNRGSFVGLKDNRFGTLTLGRQWNLEDGVMSRYFIGGGYTVFQFSEFGFISDLVDNAAKYVSPTMGGFTLQALAAPGEGTTGRTVELAATQVIGPFDAGVTYRLAKNAAGREDTQWAVGLSYQLGPVRVHGGYADSDPQALGMPKARAWDLGLVWDAMPAVTVTADYVKRDQRGTDNDSDFVRLQGIYALSKRTALFANLVSLHNDGTASQKFYGNGAPGVTQNVTSLGLRHAF